MSHHRRDFLRTAGGVLASAAVVSFIGSVDSAEDCSESEIVGTHLQRKFSLPSPLYDATSAWRQSVASAGLKQPQTEYIHEMFCLLKGHKQNFCNLNFNDFTIPVFAIEQGS